jgi:putative glutamine amidotransferase
MAKRPVIGLNIGVEGIQHPPFGRLEMPIAYVDAVEFAGGLPMILPPCTEVELFKDLLPCVDGFCLIGGDDYAPHHYGGRIQRAEELTSERRARFDWALAKHLLGATDLPVLGICGGQQLMSLVRGAGLVQDIRTEWRELSGQAPLPHASRDREKEPYDLGYRHPVRVTSSSLLTCVTGAVGSALSVNSFHHQAVLPDRVGDGLVATAWAEDGMVEAIEAAPGSTLAKDGRFLIGVQWHPERMTKSAPQQALFEALVKAAGCRKI